EFKYPPMPLKNDVLFGARIIRAKEAHTSSAQKATSKVGGMDGKGWEKTYKCPASGVILVGTETGVPTHKLAIPRVRL
ncbi:hypothetical protein HOY80DRAFT_873165, partial [Tuber brumale]